MSNKRYYILLLVCSLTAIIVAAIWKYPDIVKAKSTRDDKLGEYVYLDRYNVVHGSRKCSRLNYKANRSERIRIDDLSRLDGYKYDRSRLDGVERQSIKICPKCVSDKDYEFLTKRIYNNE